MYNTEELRTFKNSSRCLALCLLAPALLISANLASAHELWIDTTATAQRGESHEIEICWGHSGLRNSGKTLEGQQAKLATWVLQPDGSRSDLEISLQDDCFVATTIPTTAGCCVFGSELQTGIIPRDFHGIPANTRVVMYGKTLTHLAGDEKGLTNPAGFDLEIIPLTSLGELRQGGVARAKLLFRGKPLGGKNVEMTLATAGPDPLPEHGRIQSHEWTISAVPDPYTGEIAFPLIAGGKHLYSIRYTDETPGTYDGPRNDESDFSHLRKGDKYERTLYMSTLTIWVKSK